jgi:hypothetical protein
VRGQASNEYEFHVTLISERNRLKNICFETKNLSDAVVKMSRAIKPLVAPLVANSVALPWPDFLLGVGIFESNYMPLDSVS